MSCPGTAAPSLICLDQSQTSIQVTWSVLTNRRPVFRSPDLSWPIRAQSKHVTVSRNRSSYLCEQRVLQIWDQIWNLTQSHFVAAPSRTQMTLVASFFWRLFLYLTAVWNNMQVSFSSTNGRWFKKYPEAFSAACETDGSGVMICIFCRNEIRKLFSHVKEGHDRTGADIAPSWSRLETITPGPYLWPSQKVHHLEQIVHQVPFGYPRC